MSKTLSIITINKNDVLGLAATFSSVLSHKTTNELEYIVIDGNSTDGSRELIKDNLSKIDQVVIGDDEGIFDAMNKGLRLSTGKYVLFLNSGDTLYAGVEAILGKTISMQNIDVFYSDIAIKNSKNKKILVNYTPFLLLFHCLNHQNMIIKYSHLNKGYDLSYKYIADVKWQIDYLSRLKLEKLEEPISYFDLNGLSSNKSRKIVERFWRERVRAHFTSTGHKMWMKVVATVFSSIIYIIKLIVPKLLSKVYQNDI